MSTANTATRKAAPRKKTNGAAAISKPNDLETIYPRLFDPKREKKEFLLDARIMRLVASYEEYLTEAFKEKPAENKIIEVLLEKSLQDNTPFQTWLKEKEHRPENLSNSEADELLENLGDKTKAAVNI